MERPRTLLAIVRAADPAVRERAVDRIKAGGKSWARLGDTAYAVQVRMDAAAFRDWLSKDFVYDSAAFAVFDVTEAAWATYAMPPAIPQWLRQ